MSKTLQDKLDDAKAHFAEKHRFEIEHLRNTHPDARVAATIIRDLAGAYLAVYDFDRSEHEPVYFSGITAQDWAVVVTALPGAGLALPILPWPDCEAKIMAGVAAAHEALADDGPEAAGDE